MSRVYLILIVILFSGTAHAQKATPLSLDACYDYALKHSYTIKNSQLDVLIQQAQVDQTKAAALPHINGKFDFNDFNIPQRSFVDASSFDPSGQTPKGTIIPIAFTLPYAASGGITTSQTIFDGSVMVALQARKAVMELAHQNNKVTEENLRYNIFKAYNSLVVVYHQLDILKSSLKIARSLEHDITVTRDNGMAEKIDVERTSVQVNNLATDSLRISNVLTLSEQVLKYQIGMDINTPIVLTDTVIESHKNSAKSLLVQDEDYMRVPEFGLAVTGLKLNEYNVKRYRLSALPSLSGFWSYGSNYGATFARDLFSFDKYWASSTLGLSLNVPIFNGFVRVNQVREAKLNVEKSHNNIELMKQTIDFQSASARTSLKNALLQIQSLERNNDLSNDVLDLAQKKYKAGVGSNLEVTQAQTDLLRSQNTYFTALLDVMNGEADLKKALGLLK
jgi:outer membrane protein